MCRLRLARSVRKTLAWPPSVWHLTPSSKAAASVGSKTFTADASHWLFGFGLTVLRKVAGG